MAQKWQRVKFTGERTGSQAARPDRVGWIRPGAIFVVTAEYAEVLAVKHEQGDRGELSDFELVGAPFSGERQLAEARAEMEKAVAEAREIMFPRPEPTAEGEAEPAVAVSQPAASGGDEANG